MPLAFFLSAPLVLLGGGAGPAPQDRSPQDPDVAQVLQWLAPDVCPDADRVRENLRRLVNLTRPVPAIQIRAEVTRGGGGALNLQLDVTGESQESHRSLVSTNCEELAVAATLVAAIAIDPFGVATRTVTPEPELETPEPQEPSVASTPNLDGPAPDTVPASPIRIAEARPKRSAAPTRDPASPTRAPSNWSLHMIAGPIWSEQSRPTTTVRLAAAHEWGLMALRLGAEGWLPQRFSEPEGNANETDMGVSVGRLLTRIEGCAQPGTNSVVVPLCLAVNAGATIARGYGVEAPRTRASLSLGVAASAGLLWRPGSRAGDPGRLGLALAVEAMMHPVRARFHIENRSPAYEGSLLSAAVIAGVEIRL